MASIELIVNHVVKFSGYFAFTGEMFSPKGYADFASLTCESAYDDGVAYFAFDEPSDAKQFFLESLQHDWEKDIRGTLEHLESLNDPECDYDCEHLRECLEFLAQHNLNLNS